MLKVKCFFKVFQIKDLRNMVKELSANEIRKECDTSFMRCETTKDLEPLLRIIPD